jgi:hypothetical protein
MRLVMCVIVLIALCGCSTRGYVQSDIPGVAAWLGTKGIEHNTAQSCPNYGAGYGKYTEATTSLGVTRTRVEYSFQCE